MVQNSGLLIQSHKLFAVLCSAYHNGGTLQSIQIKSMHGLTNFHQYIVGDVHHGIDCIVSYCNQSSLHPERRFLILYIIDIMAQISGTELLVNHRNTYFRIGSLITGVAHIRILYFFSKESCHLTGNPQNRLTVRAVGCDRNVKHIVIQAQICLDIFTNRCIFIQNHDAVDICSRIPILVKAKLFTGAKHTIGHHILHLSGSNLQSVGQLSPY